MRKYTKTFLVTALAITSILTVACTKSENQINNTVLKQTNEVVLASDVQWEYLNAARGDKSPKAGTLWGNRKGTEATGFLLNPVDGFKSPPHIHNISYRGIVIRGLIHNDDPKANNMWMPAGSFWTQPKGHVHITSAKGVDTLAYIEIDEGPYLVLPPEKEFSTEERPVNIDKSNLVWVNSSDIVWVDQPKTAASDKGVKVAFLWGNPQSNQLSGSLVKLPAGFNGKINAHGSTFRAVVVKGQPQYKLSGESDIKTLELGSYFGSKGESTHQVSSITGEESIIYIRTDGKFDVVQ